ncbi:hypothetical protein C7I85_26165 [Mesorhizobium soli]|uniref:Uncharacterized protein n=1 Tax=Pseudaminobacter soli (ex Li et al. 2025) TaxID=1295366 RepID=A0A2P7S018_9HYPH|nr:hypothetical protein C7I85_26165 [Mesorhizobium soli]
MTNLVTINAIKLPDPGEVPVLDWLDKALIEADPLYQRPLDDGRVDAILKAFSWRSFGALVVVPQKDGRFHATDGQHRLEAAKRHPMVTYVPAVIVKAEDVQSEASIFVEINASRKNVSALELFFAKLAADDEDAETIRQVCQRAGVRIPKYPSAGFRPGDCIAIAAIQSLIGRRGAMRARQYLEILAKADLAPITATHIKAAEYLMTDMEFGGAVEGVDLTATILAMNGSAETEAKRFAATHGCPVWKGLASTWFQRCRKRRKAA